MIKSKPTEFACKIIDLLTSDEHATSKGLAKEIELKILLKL